MLHCFNEQSKLASLLMWSVKIPTNAYDNITNQKQLCIKYANRAHTSKEK